MQDLYLNADAFVAIENASQSVFDVNGRAGANPSRSL